jgi:HEAT repeat protein
VTRLRLGRVVLAIGFAAFFLLSLSGPARSQERHVEGRTLTEWLNAAHAADPLTRLAAVKALGGFGADALPGLSGALADDDAEVRIQAVKTLGRLALPDSVPLLAKALTDRSPWVRRLAAQALGAMGRKGAAEAITALVAPLGDTDPLVWDNAAAALEGLGPRAVPTLVRALSDPRARVRGGAAGILATGLSLRRLDPRASTELAPALANATRDSDVYVRMEAIRALSMIGKTAAETAPALSRVVRDDPNEEVRRLAERALRTIESR